MIDEKRIKEAKINFDNYLWVVVCSYYSMFYIANAVLLNLGYKTGDKIVHKVTSDALIVLVLNKLKKELLEEYEKIMEDALEISSAKAEDIIMNYNFELDKRSKFQYSMSEEIIKMKHKILIGMQLIFLVLIGIIIYIFYPRAEVNVNGNFAKFSSINANVIAISNNPDFSNPRYIDLNERKNLTFELNPGTYYWKPSNNLIEGFKNKFTINSEVGLIIDKNKNESNLVNVGNVKINVTKNENGVMVGHIILEPEQSEKIEDKNESYIGRENDK